MKSHGAVAALVVLVVLSGSVAPKAHAGALSKGTVELTPSLAFSHNSLSFLGTDVGSLTTLQSSVVVGYCVSDLLEVAGGPLVVRQSISDPGFGSESGTSIGFTGGVQLNFASGGQMVPFVRAAFGIVGNSGVLSLGTETTTIAPILVAGLRVLVGNSASVNFGVGYQHASKALGVQDLSSSTFGLDIGVSIFPRLGQ